MAHSNATFQFISSKHTNHWTIKCTQKCHTSNNVLGFLSPSFLSPDLHWSKRCQFHVEHITTFMYYTGLNRVRRQSRFPTFISCQRQDPNVLPKRRQSHQGDKLCDVSMVPLVARWPVFSARGSDADSEPHWTKWINNMPRLCPWGHICKPTLRTQWSWQKYCLNHCARTCCSLCIVTRCRFMNWRIRCERGSRNVHFLSINLISFRRSRGIVLVMASPVWETNGAGRQSSAEKVVRNVRDFSIKRLPSGGTRSCMPQQMQYAGVCADWEQKFLGGAM